MAPRKKTKKSESESTESTTTTSKTTKKTKKMVDLTFQPILSAADQFSALLRKKAIREEYGQRIPVYTPAIEGLPMKIVVRKGEVLSVTEEQFAELQQMGHAETDEEYKKRKDFVEKMSSQHPEKLTWDMIVAEGSNFATLRDSQFIIYNDKLLRL